MQFKSPFGNIVVDIAQAIAGPIPLSYPCPPNVALAVRKDTTSPFPRSAGRTFFAGLAQEYVSANDGSRIEESAAADLLTAYNVLLFDNTAGSLVAAGFIPVVWLRSRQVGGPDAMPVTAPITAFTLSDFTLDSAYRRLPGHYPHSRNNP